MGIFKYIYFYGIFCIITFIMWLGSIIIDKKERLYPYEINRNLNMPMVQCYALFCILCLINPFGAVGKAVYYIKNKKKIWKHRISVIKENGISYLTGDIL